MYDNGKIKNSFLCSVFLYRFAIISWKTPHFPFAQDLSSKEIDQAFETSLNNQEEWFIKKYLNIQS